MEHQPPLGFSGTELQLNKPGLAVQWVCGNEHANQAPERWANATF